MNVLTMWLAVDDSDTENGCLRVIRGSHKQALTELKDDVSVENVLGSYTHRDEDIDQSQIVDIVLKPGGKRRWLFHSSTCAAMILVVRYQYSSSEYHSRFRSKYERSKTMRTNHQVHAVNPNKNDHVKTLSDLDTFRLLQNVSIKTSQWWWCVAHLFKGSTIIEAGPSIDRAMIFHLPAVNNGIRSEKSNRKTNPTLTEQITIRWNEKFETKCIHSSVNWVERQCQNNRVQ